MLDYYLAVIKCTLRRKSISTIYLDTVARESSRFLSEFIPQDGSSNERSQTVDINPTLSSNVCTGMV